MGRGSSKIGGGGSGGAMQKDYPEAFEDGKDFQASGDVDHDARWTSRSLRTQWENYADTMSQGITNADYDNIMKDYVGVDRYGNDILYGYILTTNSFAINKALYDPANAGKTDAQIFTRLDRNGQPRDLQTVQTLDKLISQNKTPADASYTRFCSPNALKATFGFSDAQMKMILDAPNMTAGELKQLNKTLKGSKSFTNSYTSTSANRSMNAFGNPNAKQSKGFVIERKINVKKGTPAYAAKRNAQESEVIFGRKTTTKQTGISIAKDGHIVIHEVMGG